MPLFVSEAATYTTVPAAGVGEIETATVPVGAALPTAALTSTVVVDRDMVYCVGGGVLPPPPPPQPVSARPTSVVQATQPRASEFTDSPVALDSYLFRAA